MTGKVALLLEDEAIIAMDVEQTLRSEGFAVVSRVSCAEGLAWLRANTPALGILDVRLSDGDCDAAAEILAARRVPFIIYSAGAKEARRRPAFASAHWLAKPSAEGELLALIRPLTADHAG